MFRAYGSAPYLVSTRRVYITEFLYYLYMPIKFPGMSLLKYEDRLRPFESLINDSKDFFCDNISYNEFIDSYCYLTVKRKYQGGDCYLNRKGWHSDGFGTDDWNFIWSDVQPTIFNSSNFNLSNDELWSMHDMECQADPKNNFTLPNNSLLALDQYCIHKVGEPINGVRTFFKLSISKDRYDLEGNTHNYLLDYDWPMRKRGRERNVPQKLET